MAYITSRNDGSKESIYPWMCFYSEIGPCPEDHHTLIIWMEKNIKQKKTKNQRKYSHNKNRKKVVNKKINFNRATAQIFGVFSICRHLTMFLFWIALFKLLQEVNYLHTTRCTTHEGRQ